MISEEITRADKDFNLTLPTPSARQSERGRDLNIDE
jgi:hypothetical protein